jgi:hypothetical protein
LIALVLVIAISLKANAKGVKKQQARQDKKELHKPSF